MADIAERFFATRDSMRGVRPGDGPGRVFLESHHAVGEAHVLMHYQARRRDVMTMEAYELGHGCIRRCWRPGTAALMSRPPLGRGGARERVFGEIC